MSKRSLQASQEGAKLARKIFERRGWTQEGMAAELELRTRQPIWRFFTCRPIERYIFIELCNVLDLNWWEIADQVPESLLGNEPKAEGRAIGSSQLVEQIRLKHQDRIEHQSSTLRVLGTSYPTQLSALYVLPHLLGHLAHQEYIDAAQLETSYSNTLSNLRGQRWEDTITPIGPVLENHARLRIFGKPGSGKTCLLKWVAFQCNQGKFRSDLIPVFIKLESYTDTHPKFSLLSCLQQELLGSNITDTQTIETLLHEGRFLLLIDELETVSSSNYVELILKEIDKFSERYHKNRIIITSRLGVMNCELLQFADFELADFNHEQITLFARKWFTVFEQMSVPDAATTAETFVDHLQLPINQQIRELAGIPLCLNRICQIFQGKGNLSNNRIQIYEECLALIVGDWNKPQNSCSYVDLNLALSDQIYLLGGVATSLLENNRYFFEQSELNYWIQSGVQELKETNEKTMLQEETLAHIRCSFLKQGILLEQARGIMSFSHLAFQGYLVFRKIILSPNPEENFVKCLSHLTDPQWQEVFLMASSKWSRQEWFLQTMELEIRSLVAREPDLEAFLSYLQQKSCKRLLYDQVAEAQGLLYQLARTPVLMVDLSTCITYLGIWAQMLWFEVILAKLVVWLVMPNCQSLQLNAMAQPLLNQAVRIAINNNYPGLTDFLLQFREQFLKCDRTTQTGDGWKSHQVADWLEGFASAMMNECCYVEESLMFNLEQVRLLQKYLYAIQLFAHCQGQSRGTEKADWQMVFSESPLNAEFREAAFLGFLTN